MSESTPWQYANPFITDWLITANEIDHYNHVNNVAYLSQQERLAWAHSKALGLGFEHYQQAGKGMVIFRHELNYIKPAFIDDTLQCATWITDCDGRLLLTREFQYIRQSSGETIYQGRTQFACIKLDTGQPSRMPKAFADVYRPACVGQSLT
ncbi:MAG: acyl-CoA thioesterase [Alteromonadaceae bacterium]|nr:acyl-CoA thioesterase [Alteromonadaceae bacterium]